MPCGGRLSDAPRYARDGSVYKVGRRDGTLRALLEHPREVAIVVGLTLGGTIAFYTFTTYMQKFLVNTSGFSKDTATLISAAALFVYMLLQPVVGALSDIIGRRPVLIAFGVLGTLCTVPLLTTLASTRDPVCGFRACDDWPRDRLGLHRHQCRGQS